MKAAKKSLALVLIALMVLTMLPLSARAADPGAPVNGGYGREVRDGVTTYNVNYNEAGTVNYVLLEYGMAQPSYTQVKNHQDADGNSISSLYCGTVECTATALPTQFDAVLPIDLSALAPNKYNIFCVCTDGEGNTSDVLRFNIDYDKPYSFEITEKLTFTVNDGTTPISGATVKVGADIKTTGGDGKAVFTLSGGVYTYLVQAIGYQGVSGNYTADKQIDEKTVSLALGSGGEYSAVLNIKDDKGTNLKNANVIIGGVTKTADASGNVEFFLVPGEYSYSASAMGRITKSGSIIVSTENTSANAVLATDPAGVDLVINSHQKGELGHEMDVILSANSLGADAVRSLTVHGGVMGSNDFSYSGIGKLFGYDNNIFGSVDLSDTVLDGNTLPEGAFYYATHLTSITLPNTVTEIGSYAFAYCPLTSFTFPASVQVIGDSVFAYCSALKTVTFPADVTSIGEHLFANYVDAPAPVADVYMLSTNPAAVGVAGSSFYNQSNTVLHAPEGSADAYKDDARDGSTTDGKWFGLYIYDPDAANPVIRGLMAGWWDDDSAFFAFSSDSPGQFYYAMVDDGAPAPVIDTSGTGTAVSSGLEGFSVFEGPTTAKDIHIVLKGINGKLSNMLKMDMPAADAALADITINGHTEGNLADEINAELTKVNLSYNYDRVGSLTVNGGTIGDDDAEFISDEVHYLTNADFSGTSFEDNTVPENFLGWSDTLKTIILPRNVEAIGDWAFWISEALESITLGSSIPPAVGEDVFEMVPDGAVVYVPSGSKDAYLTVDDGNTTDGKWYGLTVVEIGSGSGGSKPSYSSRTLTDSETGITVSGNRINRRARLAVYPLKLHPADTCAACNAIRKAQTDGQLILGYDISLTPSATGELTISIPVGSQYNGQMVTILHCVNGRLETIISTVVNGITTFTTSSLSPFAVTTGLLVPDSEVTNPPKTGDAATPLGFIILGFVALCAGYLGIKRRKA